MKRHNAIPAAMIFLAFFAYRQATVSGQSVYDPDRSARQYSPYGLYAVQPQAGESRQIEDMQTYRAVRNFGAVKRERERGPRPASEELARRARAGVPRALSASQIDRVSGVLYWPAALQDDVFETHRLAIEQQMTTWARYGSLDYPSQTEVRERIGMIFGILKSQITSIPPQDYVTSRMFLESLLFATTRSVL